MLHPSPWRCRLKRDTVWTDAVQQAAGSEPSRGSICPPRPVTRKQPDLPSEFSVCGVCPSDRLKVPLSVHVTSDASVSETDISLHTVESSCRRAGDRTAHLPFKPTSSTSPALFYIHETNLSTNECKKKESVRFAKLRLTLRLCSTAPPPPGATLVSRPLFLLYFPSVKDVK